MVAELLTLENSMKGDDMRWIFRAAALMIVLSSFGVDAEACHRCRPTCCQARTVKYVACHRARRRCCCQSVTDGGTTTTGVDPSPPATGTVASAGWKTVTPPDFAPAAPTATPVPEAPPVPEVSSTDPVMQQIWVNVRTRINSLPDGPDKTARLARLGSRGLS
jgi:hypothetical protein